MPPRAALVTLIVIAPVAAAACGACNDAALFRSTWLVGALPRVFLALAFEAVAFTIYCSMCDDPVRYKRRKTLAVGAGLLIGWAALCSSPLRTRLARRRRPRPTPSSACSRGLHAGAQAPGASKRAAFRMPVAMMAVRDAQKKPFVEPGAIRVKVGSSSRDLPPSGAFQTVGSRQQLVDDRVLFGEPTVD